MLDSSGASRPSPASGLKPIPASSPRSAPSLPHCATASLTPSHLSPAATPAATGLAGAPSAKPVALDASHTHRQAVQPTPVMSASPCPPPLADLQTPARDQTPPQADLPVIAQHSASSRTSSAEVGLPISAELPTPAHQPYQLEASEPLSASSIPCAKAGSSSSTQAPTAGQSPAVNSSFQARWQASPVQQSRLGKHSTQSASRASERPLTMRDSLVAPATVPRLKLFSARHADSVHEPDLVRASTQRTDSLALLTNLVDSAAAGQSGPAPGTGPMVSTWNWAVAAAAQAGSAQHSSLSPQQQAQHDFAEQSQPSSVQPPQHSSVQSPHQDSAFIQQAPSLADQAAGALPHATAGTRTASCRQGQTPPQGDAEGMSRTSPPSGQAPSLQRHVQAPASSPGGPALPQAQDSNASHPTAGASAQVSIIESLHANGARDFCQEHPLDNQVLHC